MLWYLVYKPTQQMSKKVAGSQNGYGKAGIDECHWLFRFHQHGNYEQVRDQKGKTVQGVANAEMQKLLVLPQTGPLAFTPSSQFFVIVFNL